MTKTKILLFSAFFACTNPKNRKLNSIYGYWISPKYSNIALSIDGSVIEEIYPLESQKLLWNYRLFNDTLLLFNKMGDSSFHRLEFNGKDSLRFRPLTVKVDISVIDNFDLIRSSALK